MLANVIKLVSGCVTFLGGFLVVWGAVSAIESFNAFCTLTEGLTSTWVSVSLAMM